MQYWINQDWPLTPEKVPAAMAGIGWGMGENGDWEPLTDPLYRQVLFAVGGRYEELGLDDLSWNLTDVVLEESLGRDAFMNDAYAGFVKALTGVLGKPKRIRSKTSVKSRWDVENGCRIEVINRHTAVGVYVMSPIYVQVLRNSERR
ncbi:MAG: DUF6301 family protein [Propionibacteriaceae bacterium]|nr:DUF6301 family protein [Propionibacteriaceae bacterium]